MKGRGLSPYQKVVLYKLADCHNPSYGCFPSQEYLCDECEVSPRALRDSLNALEDMGLIKRERINSKGGQRQGTRYYLEFEFALAANDAGREPTGKSEQSLPAADDQTYRQMLPVYNKEEPCKGTSNTHLSAQARDEDWKKLESECREAAGEALASPAAYPHIAMIAPLAMLLKVDPPCLEVEIVEGVRYAAAYYLKNHGPGSMKSWRTAANKAQELRDDRLRPRPVREPAKPAPSKVDLGDARGWSADRWRAVIKVAKSSGWNPESWGPEPGADGSLVPAELVSLWVSQ
jgi:hypothetical protein